MGALKLRASDNGEAAASEVPICHYGRAAHGVIHFTTSHPSHQVGEWSLRKSRRHIHKSPGVNAGQMIGGRAREAGLRPLESIVIHKHETLLQTEYDARQGSGGV